MNIYVGNLSYSVTEYDLREIFEKHGTVVKAAVIKDKESGRSKGFGFIEMSNDDEAKTAIAALHETEDHGRKLVVNQARERV